MTDYAKNHAQLPLVRSTLAGDLSLELAASLKGNDSSWITEKVMYQDRVYTQGYGNRLLSCMFGGK